MGLDGCAERLKKSLQERADLDLLEQELISEAKLDSSWRLIISGRNRSALSSKNTVLRRENGHKVLVICVLDGHVNYLRNLNVFAGSISASDSTSGKRESYVYDASESCLINVLGLSEQSRGRAGDREYGKGVLGFSRVRDLVRIPEEMLSGVSLRSIGSTVISILGVLRGAIDAYVCRTKLWNLFWAFPLVEKGVLSLIELDSGMDLLLEEERLLQSPEKSISFVCMRTGLCPSSVADITKLLCSRHSNGE